MANSEFSLFLAGDTMLVDPWSRNSDPAFLALVEASRAADVSIANLETVIHEFHGYPQADSGGTYMASPPDIAEELRWAGFELLSHANNHVFDYGADGVLETHTHIGAAGLAIVGSGPDLQRARAPGYVDRNGVRVGMVAMSASFKPYWKASHSRSDVAGRPGLNPLTLSHKQKAIIVPSAVATCLRKTARLFGRELEGRAFRFGFQFYEGRKFRRVKDQPLLPDDRDINLNSVAEAAGKADWVVASIHTHNQGPWLGNFAKDAIDQGANCVFIHGPHKIRGIEFYKGCPIFYSLGDFVFEPEKVSRFPAEAYEKLGLDVNASPQEMVELKRKQGGWSTDKREAYEGIAVQLLLRNGQVAQLQLLPVDLQFDATDSARGCPRVAEPKLGRKIIERVQEQSATYGTNIRYDAELNRGVVDVTGFAEIA